MSKQVSRGSAGEYQSDERAGVARLRWRLSSRLAGRCGATQLASIRQMSRQLSRDSAVEYQAEDRKSTRLDSSHQLISYAGFCLKKKKNCSMCIMTSICAGLRGLGTFRCYRV